MKEQRPSRSLLESKADSTSSRRDSWLNTPAYTTVSQISIKGTPAERLMVVYRTVGCEYDKGGKGCTMCDFAYHADPNITNQNIQAQHHQTLDMLTGNSFAHFDLLTLGNFYNDREISPVLREHLLRSVSTVPIVQRILTESRHGYATREKLRQAKAYVRPDQTLEFALGYESSNPALRNDILNKGVPEKHLDDCLAICKEEGVDFVAYVLIKPQTLSEAEGIRDAVRTALHVLEKADQQGVYARIAFEPVFVTHGKPIEQLYLEGKYTPPKLWSVAEVLIQTTQAMGKTNAEGKLFIGLSDENLSEGRLSANCEECTPSIRRTIQAFNGHQDSAKLEQLYHSCKDEWQREIGG